MANARIIKKRIKSVGSTKKITRTMELVSTAKAKRAQDRVKATQPYAATLNDLIASAMASSGGTIDHPLCARREIKRVALIVVTANRGLCGGYNGNVFRLAQETRARLAREGKTVEIVMIGKKGIGYADFLKIPLAVRVATLDDKPRYEQATEILDPLIERFQRGEIDQVLACYTHFASASRQAPKEESILPVALPAARAAGPGAEFLWDPAPSELLAELVPLSVRTQLLRVLMEAAVSEQIARRIAMKNATENAKDLIKSLTGTYNRVRQTQITQQIAEIVGGAEAIK